MKYVPDGCDLLLHEACVLLCQSLLGLFVSPGQVAHRRLKLLGESAQSSQLQRETGERETGKERQRETGRQGEERKEGREAQLEFSQINRERRERGGRDGTERYGG